MIIRKYAACEECGTAHVLRIGVGGEPVQAHQFACTHCHSEMNVRLETGVGMFFGPGAMEVSPDDEGPIVNLHPSFLFSKDELGSATAFPSLELGAQMVENLIKAREQAGYSSDLNDLVLSATPPPQITEEWDALRASWSLTRNGNADLADKRMARFLDVHILPERPDTLADWLFQFASRLCGIHFQPHFSALVDEVQTASKNEDFERFTDYYHEHLSVAHGRRHFELMKSYLGLFNEFSQAHHAVSFGIPVDEKLAAASTNFDATRMIYGNAFEAFASNVEVLALLNNLIAGRPFDRFETLSLEKYLTLDKAGRFAAFAANPVLSAICTEADNQLRNASHHDGMEFDRKTGVVSYRSGKGGQGELKAVGYASYLAKCATIFNQAMLLFQLELLIADRYRLRLPL